MKDVCLSKQVFGQVLEALQSPFNLIVPRGPPFICYVFIMEPFKATQKIDLKK